MKHERVDIEIYFYIYIFRKYLHFDFHKMTLFMESPYSSMGLKKEHCAENQPTTFV